VTGAAFRARRTSKNWRKFTILLTPPQPFRTKWMLNVKNWGNIAILRCPLHPFRTKWTLDVTNWGKIAILEWMQRCIQNNIVDIFLLWIWSCVHSLEIVFCDCSMFCRDCPWTWNGWIENWFLFSVEVVCDCEDWFVFSWIIESRGIQAWSFCNRVLCASGIQLDVGANRLVGAPSGRRNDSKQCRRHFPSVDIVIASIL
jgi:hypothetical protein